jgi:hypothetical protein
MSADTRPSERAQEPMVVTCDKCDGLGVMKLGGDAAPLPVAALLREALLTARPYVEAACGARGLTAGMAEQNLQRIDATLAAESAPLAAEAGLNEGEIEELEEVLQHANGVFRKRVIAALRGRGAATRGNK